MPRARRLLCAAYLAVAVLALFATWSQNLAFFAQGAGAGGVAGFLAATYANPASASITIDLVLLLAPLVAWMVIEGRRVEVPFVWLYVLFAFLVAISVTFPLFLIARERRLAARGETSAALGLSALEGAALLALGAVAAAAAVWTIVR